MAGRGLHHRPRDRLVEISGLCPTADDRTTHTDPQRPLQLGGVAVPCATASVTRGGRRILDTCGFQYRPRRRSSPSSAPTARANRPWSKWRSAWRASTGGVLWRAPGLTVGYQPQKYALDPALPLSLLRLVTLNVAPKAHQQRNAEAAHRRRPRPPPSTSITCAMPTFTPCPGGELQRAMLARAILREPSLLVLDEPSQNLDAGGALEIYRIIASLARHHRLQRAGGVPRPQRSPGRHRPGLLPQHHICCCSGAPEDVSRHKGLPRPVRRPEAARTLAIYPHSDHTHHG